MPEPSLSIVIPAYNEEARIGRTLEATVAWLDGWTGGAAGGAGRGAEVIVVDDGSTDDTTRIVEALGRRDGRVRVMGLGRNRGKGAAVRAGVLASKGARVLFMDADLATPIEEYARLEAALDDGAQVAIGSRALRGAEILTRQHPVRETMGKTFNLLVRLVALGGFKDTQCGFKLFTREAADTLFSLATIDRFAFDVELLLLARGRFAVKEVPVVWRHVEQSKLSPLRDSARMAFDLLLLRLDVALRNRRAPSPRGR